MKVFPRDLSCCNQGRLMSKWDFLFLWSVANGCMDGVLHPKIVADLVVALWLSVGPNACPCSMLWQTKCLHSPVFSSICLLITFKCAYMLICVAYMFSKSCRKKQPSILWTKDRTEWWHHLMDVVGVTQCFKATFFIFFCLSCRLISFVANK